MGCKGCPNPTTPGSWDIYIACNGLIPQPIVDDNTMQNIAAQNGAQSQGAGGWEMCMAMVFIKTRRFPYWKQSPGDCGNAGSFSIGGSTPMGISAGLKTAAVVDPEPISKGILAGFSAIFSIFGAAHAQAVATEQATLCSVAGSFNQSIQYLEQYVKAGQVDPSTASGVLQQVAQQLDGTLAGIAKTNCDAACGYRVAMRGLVAFMTQIGFAALAPQNPIQALAPTAPVATPGEPGTSGYTPPPQNQNPLGLPGGFQGASGPIQTPMTGQNQGTGTTGTLSSSLPAQLDPGTIVLIGGVAFIASRLGQAA